MSDLAKTLAKRETKITRRNGTNGGMLSTQVIDELVRWGLENKGVDWLQRVTRKSQWMKVYAVRKRKVNNSVLFVIRECTPHLDPPGPDQTLDGVLLQKYQGHNNHFWLYVDWLFSDRAKWFGPGSKARRDRWIKTMRNSELWRT